MFHVDLDTVAPSRTPAQNPGKSRTRLNRKAKCVAEHFRAHTFGKIDERPSCCRGAVPEVRQCCFSGVRLGASTNPFDKSYADRDTYLEDVDTILWFGEFFKAARYDFRLDPGEFDTACFDLVVIRHEFQKEGNICCTALVTDVPLLKCV